MPADSVFAGAKFWAVWKAVAARTRFRPLFALLIASFVCSALGSESSGGVFTLLCVKFWGVWKVGVTGFVYEGVGFWTVFGLLRGNRVGQTAQNFGNHGKNEGIFLQNRPEDGAVRT